MLHINTSPNEISFSPDTKIAPIVVSGAVFLGKAIVGGAIGSELHDTSITDSQLENKYIIYRIISSLYYIIL